MRMNAPRFWLIACLFALSIWAQGWGAAHAAVHGDEPHEHDGIVCDVGTLAVEEQAVLPAPPAAHILYALPQMAGAAPIEQPLWLAPKGRAPPPRGPPAFKQ